MSREGERCARRGVLLTGLLAAVFTAGTFLVPVLESNGIGWGVVLRQVYAPVCHQLPERSLRIGSSSEAVCARCAGLYLGGVAGLVAAAWIVVGRGGRPRRSWLAWAVAPTVVDALLPWVGLAGLPNLPRLLLALPAGFVAALFLAVGIEDLISSAREMPVRGPLPADGPLEEADG